MSEQMKNDLMDQSSAVLRKMIDIVNASLRYLWEEKEQRYQGDMAIVCLVREWIASVDAIALLMVYGKAEPAKSLTRTAFEITLQLLYLSEKPDEANKKAAFYFVTNEMKKIESNETICEQQKKAGFNNEYGLAMAKEMRDKLASSEDKDQIIAYKQVRNLDRWENIKWYHLYDRKVSSLRKLCEKVGLYNGNTPILMYDTIYNLLSMQAHGISSADRIRSIDGSLQIEGYENLRYGFVQVKIVHELFKVINSRFMNLYGADLAKYVEKKKFIDSLVDINTNIDNLRSAYQEFYKC